MYDQTNINKSAIFVLCDTLLISYTDHTFTQKMIPPSNTH